MADLRRLGRVPAEVRAIPDVGERVLAWGRDLQGEAVVATRYALYLPTRTGDHARVPFEKIETAGWEDPVLDILMSGREGRRHLVRFAEPGELPPMVRERVTSTIALVERVILAGGAGARITARRTPGSDDVAWAVLFDDGVDARDPDVRAQADAAITAIRSSTGL